MTSNSKRRRWFWKTLTGYTVTHASTEKFYHVQHRPFREPKMWSEPLRQLGAKALTNLKEANHD
jgi:hypothetical protein